MSTDIQRVGPWHASPLRPRPSEDALTVVSLFAGIGGFDLGFELTGGMVTVATVEIDKHCNRVLEKHFPEVMRFDDVREFGAHSLGGRRVDVVCGGFPCQDLSVAGKRAGLDGARSGLWYHFHRILRELRPRWAVVENVPGLLSSAGGRDLGIVCEGLEELFPGAWGGAVLDAQNFGVPQRRRRVVLVAGPSREGVAKVLSLCEGCGGHPEASVQPQQDVAATLGGGSGARGFPLDTDRATFVPVDGEGRYVPDVAYALAARDAKGVSKLEGQTTLVEDRVAGTLRGDIPGFRQDDHDTLVYEEPSYAMQTVFEKANGRGVQEELAYTVDAASRQAVGFHAQQDVIFAEELSLPLEARGGQAVGVTGEVSHALTGEQGFDASEDGTGRGTPVVTYEDPEAFETRFARNGRGAPSAVVPPLKAESGRTGKGDSAPMVVYEDEYVPDVTGTLNAQDGAKWGSNQWVSEDKAVAVRTSDTQANGIGVQEDAAHTVQPGNGQAVQPVGPETVVRRLTPVECARLQGFPDDWLCLCGEDPCRCPDGPQYKALGNAVAVPLMQYIGGRIVAVDRAMREEAG